MAEHLRVVENIHWDLIAGLINCFPDVECPQQSSNTNECPLLSECLAGTDSSSPSKSHVPTFVWEWSVVCATFQIPIWVESIRIREVFLISMNSPDISLDPGILRNEPILLIQSVQSKHTIRGLLLGKSHLGSVHAAVHLRSLQTSI